VQLRGCQVLIFYGGRDKPPALLETLQEKFGERKSCKRAKMEPNKNFGVKHFSKEPNFCFFGLKKRANLATLKVNSGC